MHILNDRDQARADRIKRAFLAQPDNIACSACREAGTLSPSTTAVLRAAKADSPTRLLFEPANMVALCDKHAAEWETSTGTKTVNQHTVVDTH